MLLNYVRDCHNYLRNAIYLCYLWIRVLEFWYNCASDDEVHLAVHCKVQLSAQYQHNMDVLKYFCLYLWVVWWISTQLLSHVMGIWSWAYFIALFIIIYISTISTQYLLLQSELYEKIYLIFTFNYDSWL